MNIVNTKHVLMTIHPYRDKLFGITLEFTKLTVDE